MSRPRVYTNQQGQRGAALMICLILLLIMTLAGVSSMDGALLEIKMADTMQQEAIAVRRAEAGLVAAEAVVDGIVTNVAPFEFATADDAYYLPTDNPAFRTVDWTGVVSLAGPITSDNGIDDDDAIVIEYFGPKAIPGETVKVDTDARIVGGAVYTFRNTARSASGRNVVRLVQSLYTTLMAP